MQKFNSNNTESRFIKSILRNTYLPNMITVSDGDFLISGMEYVYKNSIIKCTDSGILITNGSRINNIVFVPRHDPIDGGQGYKEDKQYKMDKVGPSCGDFSKCGRTFLCGLGIPTAKFSVINTFKIGTFVPGVTSTFTTTSDTYDTVTHKQLGKYLRWYRDNVGIDLMGLYNCFAGEDTSFVHIDDGKIVDGNDSSSIAWIVPAHLNKTYTIYTNSATPLYTQGVFLNEFGRIRCGRSETHQFLDEFLDTDTLVKYSSTYTRPFTHSVFTTNTELLGNDNYFYLLIQTNKSHNGSIVVLEGDYTNTVDRVVTSMEEVPGVDYSHSVGSLIPSIGSFATNGVVPYSNRLIEFLTQHTITSEEDIPKNIMRVQNALGAGKEYAAHPDIWTDKIRFMLYTYYNRYDSSNYFDVIPSSDTLEDDVRRKGISDNNLVKDLDNKIVGTKNCTPKRVNSNKYDITGYVDKDVENSLFRYRSVN